MLIRIFLKLVLKEIDIDHRFFVGVCGTNSCNDVNHQFICASDFDTLLLNFFELPYFADGRVGAITGKKSSSSN